MNAPDNADVFRPSDWYGVNAEHLLRALVRAGITVNEDDQRVIDRLALSEHIAGTVALWVTEALHKDRPVHNVDVAWPA